MAMLLLEASKLWIPQTTHLFSEFLVETLAFQIPPMVLKTAFVISSV